MVAATKPESSVHLVELPCRPLTTALWLPILLITGNIIFAFNISQLLKLYKFCKSQCVQVLFSSIPMYSVHIRVQIFDVNGTFVSSFGSYGQAPGELDCISGIAVNTMGQIIVADRYNNRIQVFDRYEVFCMWSCIKYYYILTEEKQIRQAIQTINAGTCIILLIDMVNTNIVLEVKGKEKVN